MKKNKHLNDFKPDIFAGDLVVFFIAANRLETSPVGTRYVRGGRHASFIRSHKWLLVMIRV